MPPDRSCLRKGLNPEVVLPTIAYEGVIYVEHEGLERKSYVSNYPIIEFLKHLNRFLPTRM